MPTVFIITIYIVQYVCTSLFLFLTFKLITHFSLLLLFIVKLNCPLAAVTHTFRHVQD